MDTISRAPEDMCNRITVLAKTVRGGIIIQQRAIIIPSRVRKVIQALTRVIGSDDLCEIGPIKF